MIVTDQIRSALQIVAALTVLVLGIALGWGVTAHFKDSEIARIDAARVEAVKIAAQFEQAESDARVESTRMAAKWTEGVNAQQVKSDALVAALVVDRDRLRASVRTLSEALAQANRGIAATAEVSAGAGIDPAPGAERIDGQSAGEDLVEYGEECERIRIGFLDAQAYLRVIGALK